MVRRVNHEIPPSPGVGPELDEMLRGISETKDLPTRQELVRMLLERLDVWFERQGMRLGPDVKSLYQAMARETPATLLVRQEKLSRVVEAITAGRSYELTSEKREGVRYANAAAYANGAGLDIAFSEGRSAKYGLTALIGFDPRGLEVEVIPPDACDLRDRSACRSVSGTITPNRIHHLVIRVSRNLFPEDRLTDEESERETGYVFRGITIPTP